MKSTQPSIAPPPAAILREPLFRRVLIVSLMLHAALIAISLILTWHQPLGDQLPVATLPAVVQTAAALAPISPTTRPATQAQRPRREPRLHASALPAPQFDHRTPAELPPADRRPLATSLARALPRKAVAPARSVASTPATPTHVLPSYQHRPNPHPQYPRLARRRGWQGTTVLAVKVSTTGHADTVTVERSSGYRVLDRAAADTVRRWQFAPGRVGPTAVAMMIQIPVVFELAGS